MNRYTTNGEEGEILPNLLGITDEETLHNAEFEGFLMAEILFTEKLTPKTKFSVKYICDIHRTALKELYSFAGRFRSVNISKGGFVFPAGRFIPDSMRIFEEEILSQLPDHYTSQQALTSPKYTVNYSSSTRSGKATAEHPVFSPTSWHENKVIPA